MRESTIRHEHLRNILEEIMTLAEETPDETFERLIEEIKHSRLIIAGDIMGDEIGLVTLKTPIGEFGMLFTDMDEFRKVFPDFNIGANEHFFKIYRGFIDKSSLAGFVINFESEGFMLPREFITSMGDIPQISFTTEDSYTSEELKMLRDSVDNSSLEEFIEDPQNIGRYEELFERISDSTLFTLMVSRDDLKDYAEDGVISMVETGPLGFLYLDRVGGKYATVYTSEEKIANVSTPLNKYSQLVNISNMTNFLLCDDLDGMIINPGAENIVLTREVLLEYSGLLDATCNDSRLNSAIMHMFLMEGEIYSNAI